jgi:protein SCO1
MRAQRAALCIAMLFLMVLLPFTPKNAWAHTEDPGSISRPVGKIEIDEKLGMQVPLTATFRDEHGNQVRLGDLIKKPAVVALVYLSCTHTCPMLLSGLSEVLGKLDAVPGRDYSVLTISFDDRDTPETARDKKRNYLKIIGRPFPEETWKFLTGDHENIRQFSDSVGFSYRREVEGFSHPIALIVLAPGGKIVRYIYGASFLPFDLSMAIAEASKGEVGLTTRRLLLICYSYDPLKKTYVFNILTIAGAGMVLAFAALVFFLFKSGKKQ